MLGAQAHAPSPFRAACSALMVMPDAAIRLLSVSADSGPAISLSATSGVSARRCAVSHVLRARGSDRRRSRADGHLVGEPSAGVLVVGEHEPAVRLGWSLLHKVYGLAHQVGANIHGWAPDAGCGPQICIASRPLPSSCRSLISAVASSGPLSPPPNAPAVTPAALCGVLEPWQRGGVDE